MTRKDATSDGKKNKLKPNPQNEDFTVLPSTPGYKLVSLIMHTMMERRTTMQELADAVGMSQSSLSFLKTGRRLASGLEKSSIEGLARWLGLPVLSVMMLAEQVSPSDFYTEKSILSGEIARAVKYILDDPEWGSFAPREIIDSSNIDLQLYIIWCYEQATKKTLVSRAESSNFLGLARDMGEFRARHEVKLAKKP